MVVSLNCFILHVTALSDTGAVLPIPLLFLQKSMDAKYLIKNKSAKNNAILNQVFTNITFLFIYWIYIEHIVIIYEENYNVICLKETYYGVFPTSKHSI